MSYMLDTTLLTELTTCMLVRWLGDGNNDEENKWGLPTWDPKCIKTFLNYAFAWLHVILIQNWHWHNLVIRLIGELLSLTTTSYLFCQWIRLDQSSAIYIKYSNARFVTSPTSPSPTVSSINIIHPNPYQDYNFQLNSIDLCDW